MTCNESKYFSVEHPHTLKFRRTYYFILLIKWLIQLRDDTLKSITFPTPISFVSSYVIRQCMTLLTYMTCSNFLNCSIQNTVESKIYPNMREQQTDFIQNMKEMRFSETNPHKNVCPFIIKSRTYCINPNIHLISFCVFLCSNKKCNKI